jgi:hypothetical protein
MRNRYDFLLILEELHEAFRILGIFNEQMHTIDSLSNDFDLHEFLYLFLPNMKMNISSQSIATLDKAFED